jgi:hypothetical protein
MVLGITFCTLAFCYIKLLGDSVVEETIKIKKKFDIASPDLIFQ